jgi:hypothetical protein
LRSSWRHPNVLPYQAVLFQHMKWILFNGWTFSKPYDDDYLMIIWCFFFKKKIKPRPFGCWIEKSFVNMQTNHLGQGVNWTSHQSWLWSNTLIPPFLFDHKAVFIDHALKVIVGGYIRMGQRLKFHSYPHLWLNPDSEPSNPMNSLPFESLFFKNPYLKSLSSVPINLAPWIDHP